MNTLQKVCIIIIFTTIAVFSVSAQDDKQTPGKDKTPRAVVKIKDDDKQQNKNSGNDNKNRDNNKDKGNKKPGI